MNVYRLSALDSNHASWRFSNEQDGIWACAPDETSARLLAASRTRVSQPDRRAVGTPWEDSSVTSCVLDPTMSLMRAGTVVRQDGSVVSN